MTPVVKSQHSTRPTPDWLRALGRNDLPTSITLNGCTYRRMKTYKHDFFAATGRYESLGSAVVLKMGRTASLWGLPMGWIGRFLMKREVRLFHRVGSVAGIPPIVGTWGRTGLVHEYVAGGPLGRRDRPDDAFFPRLQAMLEAMHALGVAYVDLEKPENVLLGEDGRPYLIDFQISWYWPPNRFGDTWIARRILAILQASDRYHLLKHWRRARPDQMDAALLEEARRLPFWIAWHRAVFRPLTLIRRQVLVWLGGRTSVRGRSPG
ncbi:MAG: hypothetical protein ACE5EQ_02415 [Phycisphaerae bacterium]